MSSQPSESTEEIYTFLDRSDVPEEVVSYLDQSTKEVCYFFVIFIIFIFNACM
jgi:hypothetical protein